jgi:hypothetical protein
VSLCRRSETPGRAQLSGTLWCFEGRGKAGAMVAGA